MRLFKLSLEIEAEFNVIKIDEKDQQISLLYYENFFENPFPALQRLCAVDVESGRIKQLRYDRVQESPYSPSQRTLAASRSSSSAHFLPL